MRSIFYESICDKGHLGNKVKMDYRIAVSNRSYDRLNQSVKNAGVAFVKGVIERN